MDHKPQITPLGDFVVPVLDLRTLTPGHRKLQAQAAHLTHGRDGNSAASGIPSGKLT